jgi:FMN phosphatase YigB (HAD superfamily)
MAKIKLIIFDLSGVCFDLEEPPYLEKFVKKHELHDQRERFLARYDEMLLKAETGRLAGIELWRILLKEFNLDGEPGTIIKEMMDLKIPHLDVLNMAKKLKEKYTVVYLTNYNKDYWDEILRRFDLSQWFSWGVVSYEIGVRKPAKEGFEFILKKVGVKPEETVFIDDSVENLDGSRRLGIKVIRFESAKSLLKELKVFEAGL